MGLSFAFWCACMALGVALAAQIWSRHPRAPRFFCKLDWHPDPKVVGFDGISLVGRCRRCDAKVLQDSQGNWFRTRRG